MNRSRIVLALAALVAFAVLAGSAAAIRPPGSAQPGFGQPYTGDDPSTVIEQDTDQAPGNNNPQPGYHDNGRGGNTFVNDPCVDPPPPNRPRTVQSETEIAVNGQYMVAGWNDSWGFYDNRQGLSGFGYSVNGGNTWIDGGGLPPRGQTDRYFGDPVVVVDRNAHLFRDPTARFGYRAQAAGQFYYASIYQNEAGISTLSVNRGRFATAPPQTPETASNTRCVSNPALQGTPDTRNLPKERIVWERPVEAITGPYLAEGDFLDKEWLHVDQTTGTLYLTYTRFGLDGSTPIELVRSYDGGRTWTPPTVIVPNLADTFNQATFPVTVPAPGGGTRVVVVWFSRTFSLETGALTSSRIEYSLSDDDGTTFGPARTITPVNPQGEPPGYNRRRTTILNAPYVAARGSDVYVTYFSGQPGSPTVAGDVPGPRPSDIYVSSSHDGGTNFGPPVKVNEDNGRNTHVFPSVQVSKQGWVFASWLDRRNDSQNELTDAWANVSHDGGATWGHDKLQTDVATSWRVRADARPNFGDYNSSELIDDNTFVMIWADGRFPPPAPAPQAATPDTIFTIAQGLGTGLDPNATNP